MRDPRQNQQKDAEKVEEKSNMGLYITLAKVFIWFVILYLSTYANMHVIFASVSGIAFIFMNLGKRKPGDASAYSVFNKNFQRPAGSMDPDEMIFGKSKSGKS